MPGGEGSPINLLDHHHRASTAATTSTTDECANGDDVRTASSTTSTGATFTSAMTSALAGDGLRRRKVIHAARETLDKGESGAPLLRLFAVPQPRFLASSSSSLTKPHATTSSPRIPSPEFLLTFCCTDIGIDLPSSMMPPDRRNAPRSWPRSTK